MEKSSSPYQQINSSCCDQSVSHPTHYTYGRFETIEVIEDITNGYSQEPFAAYCIGNVVKYISRAPHKGNMVQDLRKARQYLDFALEHLNADT